MRAAALAIFTVLVPVAALAHHEPGAHSATGVAAIALASGIVGIRIVRAMRGA